LVIFALGIGASGYIGNAYENQPISGLSPLPAAWFGFLPNWAAGLFDQDALTIASFWLAFIAWWVIEHTGLGLRLRAVGEDAPAADAAGVNVFLFRFAAVLTGGLFCGIAGAHLSLVGSHLWVDGMVAGRGWIAVAMVTLSRWNALRAIGAALLFGAVEAIVPQLLSSGLSVPVYLIQMSPYLATLAYLLVAGLFQTGADAQPADLARPYLREERR
jgi:simple sugar transport system permease protein